MSTNDYETLIIIVFGKQSLKKEVKSFELKADWVSVRDSLRCWLSDCGLCACRCVSNRFRIRFDFSNWYRVDKQIKFLSVGFLGLAIFVCNIVLWWLGDLICFLFFWIFTDWDRIGCSWPLGLSCPQGRHCLLRQVCVAIKAFFWYDISDYPRLSSFARVRHFIVRHHLRFPSHPSCSQIWNQSYLNYTRMNWVSAYINLEGSW